MRGLSVRLFPRQPSSIATKSLHVAQPFGCAAVSLAGCGLKENTGLVTILRNTVSSEEQIRQLQSGVQISLGYCLP